MRERAGRKMESGRRESAAEESAEVEDEGLDGDRAVSSASSEVEGRGMRLRMV